MVVHHLDTYTNTFFEQATSPLIYTEFSPSGKYIFTLTLDQIIRIYEYDHTLLNYAFKESWLVTHGPPQVILSISDQYLIVPASNRLTMFKIGGGQFRIIKHIDLAGNCGLTWSIHELNDVIVIGCSAGIVTIVKVGNGGGGDSDSD